MTPSASPTDQAEATRDLLAAAAPGDLPRFPVFLEVPDLSPWRAGNTGIAGFTTRDSGRPGPHIVLVSLIHGNEIAGAIVLDEMLRAGIAPAIGKLTFGFANLAAFDRFDPQNPVASRFVEEDLNRVWDDAQLFGVRRSAELDRAREIRPLIDSADIVLDLHSMLWPSDPLLLCGPAPRGRDLAFAIGTPAAIVADQGHAGGKRLIDYGRFTEAGSTAACILVEAGQHWEFSAVLQTRQTIEKMLRVVTAPEPPPATAAPPLYAEVTQLITAKTNRFSFVRPYRGGEMIASAQTVIAHDGETEIRTPHENCLLVMPSLRPSRGHTAVRLARVVAV
jgi:succinylglutamate desuccinylase